MKKILIVDDDGEFRRHLIEVLKEEYQVDDASSATEAYEKDTYNG
jgi:CheY-like chemotaxis protein